MKNPFEPWQSGYSEASSKLNAIHLKDAKPAINTGLTRLDVWDVCGSALDEQTIPKLTNEIWSYVQFGLASLSGCDDCTVQSASTCQIWTYFDETLVSGIRQSEVGFHVSHNSH